MPRGASPTPLARHPTKLGNSRLRSLLLPLLSAPLAGSGAVPGFPAPTLEPLGKHRWGFPPVLPQPRCARSRAGAPCTPCPWAPANPNKHSRPPQRLCRDTGPPPAAAGGAQTSPAPLHSPLPGHPQYPCPGVGTAGGVPTHRGAQARCTGGHVGSNLPPPPPPSPFPFPSCSENPPWGVPS